MKLKNILFVVDNIVKSKTFYRNLFGLQIITDLGENVILTEGLVLQEKRMWEKCIEKNVNPGGNDAELYFEENDMDGFLEKLENSDFGIEFVTPCIEHEWGQRVVRIYDPDMHVIEVGETIEYVARRLLRTGMTVEQVAKKTQLPPVQVEKIVRK